MNTYAYVGSNPLRYIDLYGLDLQGAEVGAAIGSTVGGVCGSLSGLVACSPSGPFAISCSVGGGIQGALEGGIIGAILGDHIGDLLNSPLFNEEDDSDEGGGKGEPRFIGDSNGNVVDTDSTPKGSYQQPNGGRTDILQGEDHGAGLSHTHDPKLNTNPKTGGTFVNGLKKPGRPVSVEDVLNIRRKGPGLAMPYFYPDVKIKTTSRTKSRIWGVY